MNRNIRWLVAVPVVALMSACAQAPVQNTPVAAMPEVASPVMTAEPVMSEPVVKMVEPVYVEPPAEVITLQRPAPIEAVPIQRPAPKPEVVKAPEKKPEPVRVRQKPTPTPMPVKEPEPEIPVIVIESKPVVPPVVDESMPIDLSNTDPELDLTPDADVMPTMPELAVPTEEGMQTAMLTPETPELPATAAPAEVPKIDLESLPVSFANQWSVDRRNNPLTGKTECILTSKTLTISDGYDNTSVQLLITSSALYAKTRSSVDLTYPETGVRVDSGTLVAFNNVVGEKSAVISGGADSVYDHMTSGSSVKVRLGFWPTWPVTETREASFPLAGFADGRAALRACDQM